MRSKNTFIYIIFFLALIERVWFDLGPNVELITLASVIAAFYLKRDFALGVTLALLIVSDLMIGNSNIFLFTWSGFLIPILFANYFKKLKINSVFSGLLAGVSSNLFFYTWTNFGVWAMDSWGMYPKTLLGLIQSYINGIPFLKYQLTSTLFFVPLGFLIYELLFNNLVAKIKKSSAQFVLPQLNG